MLGEIAISRASCARLSRKAWPIGLLLFALAASTPGVLAQAAPALGPVIITVVDENGVAVRGAQLTLAPAAGGEPVRGETDIVGRATFPSLPSGAYWVSVEKTGFYPISNRAVDLTSRRALEITLPHLQEYQQRVEVHYTPPVIDPQQTAETQTLSSRDVINIPYSTNRDYRNVLPMMPGVIPAADGQIHVNGSSATQIYQRLDGFNISEPVTGLLQMRLSPDALRSVDVIGSRLPADLGKS